MSMSKIPLRVVQEIDPLVNLSNLDKRRYAAYVGGKTISYQPYLAPNVNNSVVQMTTYPPSPQIAIDPKVFVMITYQLTFTGTSTSGNLLQIGLYDAPRSFPLSQTCSTMSANINGQAVTTVLNQYFNEFIRYGLYYDEMDKCLSSTPDQLDQCVQYSDLFGTNRSPFALYGENVFQDSRGSFAGIQIVSNTTTSAVVNLTVYEPIFLPTFYFNKAPLLNISTLNWIFTFQNLNRVWSHDITSPNTITNLVTNITQFQMIYKFISPKEISQIPKNCIYGYHSIVPIISIAAPVVAGASTTITSQALNLQSVPKLIYIFVRKQDADLTYNDADSYFNINNISVNYNNVTGLLASAPMQALYHISSENGYNGSYGSWTKYNGSVICLRVGKDIGLESLSAPSLLSAPQFSVVVQCTNISNATITPQLFVEVVYEGTMTIGAGTMSLSTAVLSSSDVLEAELSNAEIVQPQRAYGYYGGSIMDSLISVGKDIVNLTKSGTQLGAEVAPFLGAGAMVGGRRKKRGGDIIGGRKHRGGQMMDRMELMNINDEYEE